jgi:glutaminase
MQFDMTKSLRKVELARDSSVSSTSSLTTARRRDNKVREEALEAFKRLDKNNHGKIPISDVQSHLKIMKQTFDSLGIQLKDAYFKNMIEDMDEDKDGYVSFEEFERTLHKAVELMHRARTNKLIIPDFPAFCEEIKQIYEEVKPIKAGKNASYIPQLEKMDPELWGVAIETVDGQRFSYGDAEVDFSIQSCSKPITYCLAHEELGVEEVRRPYY